MPAIGGMSLQDEIARKLQSRNKPIVSSVASSNQPTSKRNLCNLLIIDWHFILFLLIVPVFLY